MYFGSLRLSRLEHISKAPPPIEVTVSGTVICLIPEHFENAQVPISVTPSGILMLLGGFNNIRLMVESYVCNGFFIARWGSGTEDVNIGSAATFSFLEMQHSPFCSATFVNYIMQKTCSSHQAFTVMQLLWHSVISSDQFCKRSSVLACVT